MTEFKEVVDLFKYWLGEHNITGKVRMEITFEKPNAMGTATYTVTNELKAYSLNYNADHQWLYGFNQFKLMDIQVRFGEFEQSKWSNF